jgi:hypothetical protein
MAYFGWASWVLSLLWGLFHLILGLPFTLFDLYLAFAWINLLFLIYSIYYAIKNRKNKDFDFWLFFYIVRFITTAVAFWLYYLVSPTQSAFGSPLFIILVIYTIVFGYF